MYFHGSPHYLTPGTILEPGEKVGYEHNGVTHGCQHVYMTADDGWSISDLHPDDRLGTADTLDFALQDAYLWGYGDAEGPYLHIVEPLGPIEYDPHWDAGPAARRTTTARVIAVLEGPREELLAKYKEWKRINRQPAA